MDDNKKIPGIDSWIRINAYDEEDLRRLRDFAYPEDLADVERYLVHLRSEKLSRFVVLNHDPHTGIVPERVFEQTYLGPEEGFDDLVLNRLGSNAFEVFTRSESTSTERAQNRIHILGIVQGDLSKARAADAWIHGDAE